MPFRTLHYLIPIIAAVLGILSQYVGLDIWLAQQFYDPQQHIWPYQDNWLTQTVIHRGGRDLIGLLVIGTLVFFIMSLLVARWRPWRLAAGYLLVASLSGMLIISQLKSHTHIYSPWDLKMFGGLYPHIRLFDTVSQNSPVGFAFPAGHAGGGYALLSIYFLLRQTVHRYRHYFLLIALLVGMIFGIDQQIRGAHMLSHDLFTFSICWMSCLVWAKLFFNRQAKNKTRPALARTNIPLQHENSLSAN